MDEGGGMDSEERRVERVDIEVDAEDSRDRTGWTWTWISSLMERFRLRDIRVVVVVGGVVFVFIEERFAAAALRFDVEEDRFGV